MNLIDAVISGFLSGLSLGLTGSGGSVLAVPLLVYFVGLDPHTAVGTSLVAVGITAIIGFLMHWRKGNVDFKTGALMALTSIPGVYIGSYLNRAVEGPLLMTLFAILMVIMAIKMARNGSKRVQSVESGKEISHINVAGLGFLVGLASGFFGVGGGFLLVPALTMGAGLKMHRAVGTSLFVIVLNGSAGFVSYEIQGRAIDLVVVVLFVLGGLIGDVIGVRIAKSLSCKELKQVFTAVVILVALYLIWVNLPKIL
ncbi:sulfite exporter TauE/SafE family protein [Thermococcus sp. GR6]|uniref:sulfite exporter TauE/SafE family protein n=1 Tax=Thermococcus sp. GR6 TaxID=1638256 RepID=UPI00142F91B9|nr:sulfite exporter TauE/SafE family protein [Thermococcus sp. GR6]